MKQICAQNYRELAVYKLAFEAAMALYWLMPQMLVEEGDLLEQQIVGDSRRVCTLLAEAWETRRYYKAFIAKLNEVEMKVAAVQTWLAFAMECGYLKVEVGQMHRDRYTNILEEINQMAEDATDWSVRAAA